MVRMVVVIVHVRELESAVNKLFVSLGIEPEQ